MTRVMDKHFVQDIAQASPAVVSLVLWPHCLGSDFPSRRTAETGLCVCAEINHRKGGESRLCGRNSKIADGRLHPETAHREKKFGDPVSNRGGEACSPSRQQRDILPPRQSVASMCRNASQRQMFPPLLHQRDTIHLAHQTVATC